MFPADAIHAPRNSSVRRGGICSGRIVVIGSEAVQDGKLSNSDMMELRELRKDLEVTDAADDKTERRREIYNEAVSAQKEKPFATPLPQVAMSGFTLYLVSEPGKAVL